MKGRELARHLAREQQGPLRTDDGLISPRTLHRMHRDGDLVRLLPGVSCFAEARSDFTTRLLAVSHWNPDAVITGMAAAQVVFWREARVSTIDIANVKSSRPYPGYAFHRTRAPTEHILQKSRLRVTSAAWTAVWLSAFDGGAGLEVALRQRAISVESMVQAMADMSGLAGNTTRGEIVKWSVHKPWSHAERRLHRILLDAGITDWDGNAWYVPPQAREEDGWPVDIKFRHRKVVVEFLGYEFHQDRRTWQRDLRKANVLQLDGWIVLQFTWGELEYPDKIVAQVRAALVEADPV